MLRCVGKCNLYNLLQSFNVLDIQIRLPKEINCTDEKSACFSHMERIGEILHCDLGQLPLSYVIVIWGVEIDISQRRHQGTRAINVAFRALAQGMSEMFDERSSNMEISDTIELLK